MALTITIDGVDRAYAVRLIGSSATGSGFNTSSAALPGTVESGLIEVEDPDGSLEIVGWRGFHIDESTASPVRIATGFIANVDQTAGPFRTGPGRVHQCETVDLNWNLTRIRIGVGGKRPIETDVARVSWLLGHASLAGLVYAGDLTDLTNNVVNLGEADFTDQYPIDVLTDLAPYAGKTAYVTWDYTNNRPQLFYDLVNTTTYDSPAAISDVLADSLANPTTVFPPRNDPVLHRVIEEGYSDMWLRWLGGVAHAHDAAFESAHARRDLFRETSRIGILATAIAQVAKELAQHNHETFSIDCEVEVAAAHVNDILEGHRIYFRSSHLTNFTSFAYSRVERRTVRQVDDQARRFVVGLQLSDRVLSALPGGAPPSDFPHPPAAPPFIVQTKTVPTDGSGNITLDQTPSVGNVLVAFVTRRAGAPDVPTTGPAWSQHPDNPITPQNDGARMLYRDVDPADTATMHVVQSFGGTATVWEIAGVASTPDSTSSSSHTTPVVPAFVDAGVLSPTAGINGLFLEGIVTESSDGPATTRNIIPVAPWSEDADQVQPGDFHPMHWAGHRTANPTSGTYSTDQDLFFTVDFTFQGWGGLALVFAGASASDNPPQPGQPVPWAEVDVTPGSTTSTGTTAFPYANGSLQIKVDGVLISPASYTETDPATGAFTLLWVIDADEVVTVTYLGR